MVSLPDAIGRGSGSWTFGVRIESLGTVDGQYTFHAGDAPDYAADDPLWMPLLAKLPDTLSTRIAPRGGLRDAGGFTFELFDKDEFLTRLFRWDAPAKTQVWGAVSAADTEIPILQASIPDLLYIEREAVVIESWDLVSSPPVATVTRGALGTEAAPHEFKTPIKIYPPRLERRHVELFMVPRDADDDDDRLILDSFVVRKVDYAKDWCGYVFECANLAMGLKRTIADVASGHFRVTHVIQGQTLSLERVGTDRSLWSGVNSTQRKTVNPWPNENAYFLLGEKEIFIGSGSELNGIDQVRIFQRGRVGTSPIELPTDNVYAGGSGPTLRPVLVASKDDGICSFRRGHNDQTDRSVTADFEQDTHFTTILLCLFTSSRHPDDGLEMVNFQSGLPNYSTLAPGWGCGKHYSTINVPSFLSARARTPDWNFDGFILYETTKLWQLLQTQFLEPLGAFITLDDLGRITFVLPRAPYEGLELAGFSSSNTIAEPRAAGSLSPAISGGFDSGATIRGILFELRGPTGENVKTFIAASDLIPAASSSKLVDGEGDDFLTIKLGSVLADQRGGAPFLEEVALRILSRIQNPPLAIALQADLGMYQSRSPGVLSTLSFEAGPNHVTGARGWDEDIVLIGERSISLSSIARNEPTGPDFVLYKYGSSDRAGLIGPTARITAWNGGTNTATIEVNRYTDVDADAEGLPDDDQEALLLNAIGSDSRWILLRENGTRASPVGGGDTRWQLAIDAPAANQIQFDGDWMATAAAGLILALAEYDDSIDEDQTLFAADADEVNRTVGSSQRDPWPYAEL